MVRSCEDGEALLGTGAQTSTLNRFLVFFLSHDDPLNTHISTTLPLLTSVMNRGGHSDLGEGHG